MNKIKKIEEKYDKLFKYRFDVNIFIYVLKNNN